MARAKNEIETVTFTVSTTPHVERYLRHLLGSGLYGHNVAEAAERLITAQIKELFPDETKPRIATP
jgi:hypothetical protein